MDYFVAEVEAGAEVFVYHLADLGFAVWEGLPLGGVGGGQGVLEAVGEGAFAAAVQSLEDYEFPSHYYLNSVGWCERVSYKYR